MDTNESKILNNNTSVYQFITENIWKEKHYDKIVLIGNHKNSALFGIIHKEPVFDIIFRQKIGGIFSVYKLGDDILGKHMDQIKNWLPYDEQQQGG